MLEFIEKVSPGVDVMKPKDLAETPRVEARSRQGRDEPYAPHSSTAILRHAARADSKGCGAARASPIVGRWSWCGGYAGTESGAANELAYYCTA